MGESNSIGVIMSSKNINQGDAGRILKKCPQILEINSISDIKGYEIDSKTAYIVVNFKMEIELNFDKVFVLTKVDDDNFECESNTNLFSFLKHFMDIDETTGSSFNFSLDDVRKALLNRRFLATAHVTEIFGKSFSQINVIKILD